MHLLFRSVQVHRHLKLLPPDGEVGAERRYRVGNDLQFQRLRDVEGQPLLYEHIAQQASGPWNLNGQLGLVVGATYPQELARVRELAPTLPLLIPGVGAQGGDAVATVQAAQGGPMVINSSRAILYASAGMDFATAARAVALETRIALNNAALQA
mgnify:CR=1 FL=1